MAGIAGSQIALAAAQPPIGGLAKAVADGGALARGCTTNFIGYGRALQSAEPLPRDFIAADDADTTATTVAQVATPTYTAIPGDLTRETLSWVLV